MALSTLDTIRKKVRRLTQSPSEAQLSTFELDQYINTSIENDIPTTMKLFSLRTLLTFYTQPGVDVYKTNTTDPLDPLFNFKNKYTAVHNPVFIAGVPTYYTQWRTIFYANWPQTNFISDTGLVGDGTVGPFVGIINSFPQQPFPLVNKQFILQKSVVFTALDASGTAMILVDTPVTNQTGTLATPNSLVVLGTINYVTGAFSFSFPSATAVGTSLIPNPIWSEVIVYTAGIPTTMLYYDNQFTLRPVPDKAYVINIEANIRPVELLSSMDEPQITQWWQWISALAARKVFEDRLDIDSVQLLTPFLEEQQALALSTSMEQYTNQRTVTIYSNNGVNQGWNNNNNGNWPF